MTRLGIVVAISAEARCLATRRINPGELTEIDRGIWLWLCGIGADRAQRAAEMLLDAGAGALLSWGTAAGLDPTLRPGHPVLPATILSCAGDRLRVDAGWHARLCQSLAGYPVKTGPLAESAGVVAAAADKTRLFQSTGAIAVDMESAAVARVAKCAGVPSMAIRVVADPAGRSIPSAVIDSINANGRLELRKLGQAIFRRPQLLAALLRLHRDSRAAYAMLAGVAKLIGPNLQAQ